MEINIPKNINLKIAPPLFSIGDTRWIKINNEIIQQVQIVSVSIKKDKGVEYKVTNIYNDYVKSENYIIFTAKEFSERIILDRDIISFLK